MLKKRLLSSLFLVLSVLTCIFFVPEWLFTIVASLFIAAGLYEFLKMYSKQVFPTSFICLGVTAGMLLPYITYFYRPSGGIWEALFFIISLIMLFLIQFTRKENNNAVTLIALTLLGIFYIGWFFTFLVKIRLFQQGDWLVFYLLLVTKIGDAGAYLIGSKFGKHKLIPRISPKKSVEGALGGFLFSMVFALAAGFMLRLMPLGKILISAVLIGVFAQLGDLAESLIKRDFQVKDSSPFFPGLGGLLDVLDSVLFTTPIFYIFLVVIRG